MEWFGRGTIKKIRGKITNINQEKAVKVKKWRELKAEYNKLGLPQQSPLPDDSFADEYPDIHQKEPVTEHSRVKVRSRLRYPSTAIGMQRRLVRDFQTDVIEMETFDDEQKEQLELIPLEIEDVSVRSPERSQVERWIEETKSQDPEIAAVARRRIATLEANRPGFWQKFSHTQLNIIAFSLASIAGGAAAMLALYASPKNPFTGKKEPHKPYLPPPGSIKVGDNFRQWTGGVINIVNKDFVPPDSDTTILHFEHTKTFNEIWIDCEHSCIYMYISPPAVHTGYTPEYKKLTDNYDKLSVAVDFQRVKNYGPEQPHIATFFPNFLNSAIVEKGIKDLDDPDKTFIVNQFQYMEKNIYDHDLN